MASKTTLNAKNLETLGAARLANLLIEISTGSAVAKRRLRLELAGAQSPKEAGREVSKRLTSIARARSFVNWKNRKPLVTDLESQLRAIKEQIAPDDPAEGLALLWRFMQVARPLFERCDDSSGIVIEVFHHACATLGEIALAAGTPAEQLADAAVEALCDNGYGQYDGLIAILTPALGEVGLAHLKQRIEALAATPVPVPPKGEWEAVGYGSGGTTYAHQMEERSRQSTVRMALKDIADAMGDVDAFSAQYDPKTRKVPKIAAEIAARLLAAGRAGDALGFIERAEVDSDRWVPCEWQDTRLEVLEALDRKDEAQAFRWSCFESTLNTEYLRDFLKRLPDFEDIDAEEPLARTRACAAATWVSKEARRASPNASSRHAWGQPNLISRKMIREEVSRHRRKQRAVAEPVRRSGIHAAAYRHCRGKEKGRPEGRPFGVASTVDQKATRTPRLMPSRLCWSSLKRPV
jgi:hypothetical protein